MKTLDPAGWRIKRAGDNVLLLVGFGAWGPEDARRFLPDYHDAARSFVGRPWALLGDASDWVLDNPVVQDLLREANRDILDTGCRAGSFYTGPGALNRLLLYRLFEPDSDVFRLRVHPARKRAVDALGETGFSIDESNLNSFFREEGIRS